MIDLLMFLISITFILLAGIISIYLAKATRVPLPLFLFAFGVILGNIEYEHVSIIQMPGSFLEIVSVVALLLVLFDALSKVRFGHFDASSHDALLFFFVALIVNMFAMSYLAMRFFGISLFAAVIFSLLISCIEYSAVFSRKHIPHNKLAQLLKDESTISCAFILLIPFLILMYVTGTPSLWYHNFSGIFSVAVNLLAGIGIGLLMSLILYRSLHIKSLSSISYLVVVLALLIAYVFAEMIQGSGLIAVATMGIIFGNVLVKNRYMIDSYFSMLDSVVAVLLFIIVGIVVPLPLSWRFFRISLFMFLIYVIIRMLVAVIVLWRHRLFEKFEMALFVPKGLATVTVAFALLGYSLIGVGILVQLLLAFFVYSLIFDTILDKCGVFTHRALS